MVISFLAQAVIFCGCALLFLVCVSILNRVMFGRNPIETTRNWHKWFAWRLVSVLHADGTTKTTQFKWVYRGGEKICNELSYDYIWEWEYRADIMSILRYNKIGGCDQKQ